MCCAAFRSYALFCATSLRVVMRCDVLCCVVLCSVVMFRDVSLCCSLYGYFVCCIVL